MRRWVSSGDHVLREWTAAAAVHDAGQPAGHPARHDRPGAGLPLVRPRAGPGPDREPAADAAIIEERATDGRGLLADDGVSVANLFTGDAPRAVLTMSRAGSGAARGSGVRSPGS